MTDYQEQIDRLERQLQALEWELTYGFGPTARKPTFQEIYYRLSATEGVLDDVEIRLSQLEETMGEMQHQLDAAVMPEDGAEA